MTKNMTKEKEIQRTLRTLGVNGSYLGFYQTSFAVKRVMENELMLIYISKGLYVETAARFQTSVACVERNIRTVIQIIWEYGDRELLEEMAEKKLERKPRNVEFLDMLARYMRDQQQ
ncbi:MAG: sporulation initiation factor Spo0A C-terminal domain-containing protein [bacterium]|nr:sporulation initiation factor Spo0A C-terminal domain-containing protein [bacterium]